MLKDFLVADGIGIQTQDKYIDLHNEFDLSQIRIIPKDRTVELEFTSATHEAALPYTILLQFLDVDWLQISPNALSSGAADVLELGYKDPLDNDHNWLLREEQAPPQAHFFLRLFGDEYVRLHARRAKAVL